MQKNKMKEKIKTDLINNIIKESDITLKFNEKKEKNLQNIRINKKVTKQLNKIVEIAKFPLFLNLLENKNIIKRFYNKKKPNILKINEFFLKKSNIFLNFQYLNLKITSKLILLSNKFNLIT